MSISSIHGSTPLPLATPEPPGSPAALVRGTPTASNMVEKTSAVRNDAESARKEKQDGITTLSEAVEQLNRFVSINSTDIQFAIDKESNSNVVRVIDRETQDVIRQIPSEEALRIAQSLDTLLGLLVKQKA